LVVWLCINELDTPCSQAKNSLILKTYLVTKTATFVAVFVLSAKVCLINSDRLLSETSNVRFWPTMYTLVDLNHRLIWSSQLKSTMIYNIKLKILNIHIAAAVVWLCSDAAAFMVGYAMVIDGGQIVR
jgi:hypothetical protein